MRGALEELPNDRKVLILSDSKRQLQKSRRQDEPAQEQCLRKVLMDVAERQRDLGPETRVVRPHR